MCYRPYNPALSCEKTVWAVPGSLATTTGISVDVLPRATEMFQFAARLHLVYRFNQGSPDITLEELPH